MLSADTPKVPTNPPCKPSAVLQRIVLDQMARRHTVSANAIVGHGTKGGVRRRVELEYARGGEMCDLAGWEVRREMLDRCAPKRRDAPLDQLVEQFMTQGPCDRKARRVFVSSTTACAPRQRSLTAPGVAEPDRAHRRPAPKAPL